MQSYRQQQEPTEATLGRLRAATERSRNPPSSGGGGCQILTKRDKSTPIKEEALVESGAIGPFWPAEAKLAKLRKLLDLPAATLMTPHIWNVIEAALADRMTMKDITALGEEITARLAEKTAKAPSNDTIGPANICRAFLVHKYCLQIGEPNGNYCPH